MIFLHWFNRICKALATVAIAAMVWYYLSGRLPLAGTDSKGWLLFLFFPLGLTGGLLTGFRNSGWGGRIAIFSTGLFFLLHEFLYGIPPGDPTYILLSVPGFLFLIHGMIFRYLSTKNSK